MKINRTDCAKRGGGESLELRHLKVYMEKVSKTKSMLPILSAKVDEFLKG